MLNLHICLHALMYVYRHACIYSYTRYVRLLQICTHVHIHIHAHSFVVFVLLLITRFLPALIYCFACVAQGTSEGLGRGFGAPELSTLNPKPQTLGTLGLVVCSSPF